MNRNREAQCAGQSGGPLGPTPGYAYAPGALVSLNDAAADLHIDPEELREACEERAQTCGDVAVANLAGGIVGLKSAGAWRFRIPIAADAGVARPGRDSRGKGRPQP